MIFFGIFLLLSFFEYTHREASPEGVSKGMAVGVDEAPSHREPPTAETNGDIHSGAIEIVDEKTSYDKNDDRALEEKYPEDPFLREQTENDDLEDEENNPDYQCGWFRITCNCLKPFRSAKWALALLCLSSVMQGFIVNGLLNVVISTIEKVGKRKHLASWDNIYFQHDHLFWKLLINNSIISLRLTAISSDIKRIWDDPRNEQRLSDDLHFPRQLFRWQRKQTEIFGCRGYVHWHR